MLINNADAGNVEMIYIDGMTRCVKLENLKLSQDPHFYTTTLGYRCWTVKKKIEVNTGASFSGKKWVESYFPLMAKVSP